MGFWILLVLEQDGKHLVELTPYKQRLHIVDKENTEECEFIIWFCSPATLTDIRS